MKIKVIFFATLREYAGARTVEMEIPVNTSVTDLRKLVIDKYPQMRLSKNAIIASINREFASDEQIIPPDAEIALFPPVSGG